MEQKTRHQVYKACPIPGLEAFLAYYAEGEVDKHLIQATLENALLGKEFNPFGTVYRAGRVIVDLFSYSKKWSWLQDSAYSLTYSRETQSQCNVYWKKMWVGSVTIHKKKGQWVRGYFGSSGSYDWTVSSIEVNGFEDIPSRVAGIEAALDRKEAEEQKKLREACEIYKKLREMFPSDGMWQIESKLKYVAAHIYELDKRSKE